MNHLYNYLKGIAIGIANVIPGVSGGTMAFILGIYSQLTDSIGNFLIHKDKRRSYLIFLAIIGLGALTGIVLFARFFTVMLQTPTMAQATYMFFIGLIIGSIPFIISLHDDMKPNFSRVFLLIIAVVLITVTSLFGTGEKEAVDFAVESELFGIFKMTEISVTYGIWLFICGILAAGSMVLPGFSGSALLISLGEYSNILHFVDERMIVPVMIIGAGAVPGIIIFAKIISYFLKKYPSETYYFIIGLLIASVYQVYGEMKPQLTFETLAVVVTIITFALGFFVSYLLSKIKPVKVGE